MKESTSKAGTPTSWARLIESKYACRLSSDLVEWFDSEIWREGSDGAAGGSFDEPIEAEELLADVPGSIWPALMPCDLLPLVGNGMGDWLCVRVGNDNTAREVVHWYHGGGDWIPWGDGIAQALVFSHLRRRLPQGDRDYVDGTHALDRGTPSRLTHWSTSQVGGWNDEWSSMRGNELANALLENQLCEVAIRCQLVIDALATADSPSSKTILAEEASLPPFVSRESIDESAFHQLNWTEAAAQCELVIRQAPHLAWGWDVAGYAMERVGNHEQAISLYRQGLHRSAFTDQCVRIGTHAFTGGGKKFSALRLAELGGDSLNAEEREYLDCLNLASDDSRRRAVHDYFRNRAVSHQQAGRFESAFQDWYRAGWDIGAEPLNQFPDILESVVECGQKCGAEANAALAGTHRKCFAARYEA